MRKPLMCMIELNVLIRLRRVIFNLSIQHEISFIGVLNLNLLSYLIYILASVI